MSACRNLAHGSVMRLENPQDVELTVERGQVWITQEGDTADFVVRSGESFRFDRGGLALVSACGRSLAMISFAS
jgi:ferric-dicitrate binding protein FerR (iron transport regulator)